MCKCLILKEIQVLTFGSNGRTIYILREQEDTHMIAQILKITTPFNSVLYWTGGTLSENIADAAMVTDSNRIAWCDKCSAAAMESARGYFADVYSDGIVEVVSI